MVGVGECASARGRGGAGQEASRLVEELLLGVTRMVFYPLSPGFSFFLTRLPTRPSKLTSVW